jgi:molybdopterin converting factor small subunit
MKIHIPTPLRTYTGGQESVEVAGGTVGGALAQLTKDYPALQANLFTPEGRLRSFVNLYLNEDDIRYLPGKEDSPTKESDELTIIPSIAGGSPAGPAGRAHCAWGGHFVTCIPLRSLRDGYTASLCPRVARH